MKHPNGYGTVVKLSGNRRNPYAVRKTVGFDEKYHPIYLPIGYTQTKEALSSDPKTITTISSKTFTKGNSPLDFRNFMTFSLKEDFSTEFYADNEFYIKEVVSMDQRQFYLYKFDKTTNTVSPKIMSKYMNGIDFYVK